jgi:hypothetical protein
MDEDVEAFVRGRRDEMAREQIECRLADLIWVLAALVALSQPLLAERVGNIQDMKLVGDVSFEYH